MTTAALLGLGLNAATIERAFAIDECPHSSAHPARADVHDARFRSVANALTSAYRPAMYWGAIGPAEPQDQRVRIVKTWTSADAPAGEIVEIAVSAEVIRRLSRVTTPD
jgi:hypothetical protein